jgi:hypothetical protein
MKVYIVQQRYWHYNDDYYVLDDCYPVQAFESRDDAERLCQQRNAESRWGEGWMLTETGAQDAQNVDMYEVVEAEVIR